jgi:hypothetical protein
VTVQIVPVGDSHAIAVLLPLPCPCLAPLPLFPCLCRGSQGTSRGGANIKEIVRRIDLWGLDMVFVVGGNGGNAAADAIQREVEKQGVRCVVAGVPKSIDNDILLVRGFGVGGLVWCGRGGVGWGWAGVYAGCSWCRHCQSNPPRFCSCLPAYLRLTVPVPVACLHTCAPAD